tara:strand:- start:555 stop:737 length:183 start_codon:yes stop_codon:yes gene_type:complete
MKVTLENIAEKLDRLEKKVDVNSKDIIEINKTLNMGTGGVKVLVWLSAIAVTIVGWRFTQ